VADIARMFSFTNLKRVIKYLFNYGVVSSIHRVLEELSSNYRYKKWILQNEINEEEINKKKNTFDFMPKISIIVPTFNTPLNCLKEMIESVINQSYTNWELCIADGSTSKDDIHKIIDSYSKESRIKIKYLEQNFGIADNSNEALALSTGSYIAFLDHDDTIPSNALAEVVRAINKNPDADFIYSDEDKISENGSARFGPHFKPDWSPDTFRSHNYICHLSIIKRELLDKIGYFRTGYDGSQDYDLYLRATENANNIIHIPKVLYHWRSFKGSTSAVPEAKLYAYESAKKALKGHLKRTGVKATVADGFTIGSYSIDYKFDHQQKVSIIIPNTDHVELLKNCIESILFKTNNVNYEIIIVECRSTSEQIFNYYETLRNNKRIKVIIWDKPFNYSKVNNYAAERASGNVLLFLNNDTKVITNDWLESLLRHTLRQEIGAVGAKLIYPNNKIQHAGIIIGLGGIAENAHKHYPKKSAGYMRRLSIVQNVSAVTGACMMIRKDVFKEVGGFDEEFALAYNDVDLCMKLREKGYLIIFTPYAELYHYESKTRGYEDTPEKKARFKKEAELFMKKWGHIVEKGDPYYNPNLTLKKTDFSLKI
jgi:GT2 family glycosyltransferase